MPTYHGPLLPCLPGACRLVSRERSLNCCGSQIQDAFACFTSLRVLSFARPYLSQQLTSRYRISNSRRRLVTSIWRPTPRCQISHRRTSRRPCICRLSKSPHSPHPRLALTLPRLHKNCDDGDLTLVCGAVTMKVHGFVLEIRSKFFAKACSGQFKASCFIPVSCDKTSLPCCRRQRPE